MRRPPRFKTLAHDPRWVGGRLAILAVLHTWSRSLAYHPHVHLLVSAGGLSPDGSAWVKPAHRRFLVPGYALSQLFRGKIRAALVCAGLAPSVPPDVYPLARQIRRRSQDLPARGLADLRTVLDRMGAPYLT